MPFSSELMELKAEMGEEEAQDRQTHTHTAASWDHFGQDSAAGPPEPTPAQTCRTGLPAEGQERRTGHAVPKEASQQGQVWNLSQTASDPPSTKLPKDWPGLAPRLRPVLLSAPPGHQPARPP